MIDKSIKQDIGFSIVKPSKNGSRPGYRRSNYDGSGGGLSDSSNDKDSSPGPEREDSGNARENYRSTQYSSPKPKSTPTISHSPHTKSGYTGPTNYGPQQPPQEIIGDKSFNVTPDTRDKREEARVKQSILDAPIPNITDKGISFFKDGNLLTNSLVAGDNPSGKSKFNMGNILFNAGMFAISPALFAKYQKGKRLYSGAKFLTNTLSDVTGKNVSKPFDVVEDLTKNINLKDKNIIKSFKDSLTNNLTSKTKTKTKPVINTNTDNDRDGIATLEKMDLLQDEYKTLLQKGNLNDEEQVRFNMSKNMLGI